MKTLYVILVATILLVGCRKTPIEPPLPVIPELQVVEAVGIKLESSFVTSEVAMNVKSDKQGQVVIKVFDIANRVVSKEALTVKAGDNLVKVYTTALPSSAYRIGLFDINNKMLGITDFNKL